MMWKVQTLKFHCFRPYVTGEIIFQRLLLV